jgi:hypothetical protein
MVGKINRGSSLFSALIYNQQKGAAGSARVIGGPRMMEGGDSSETAIQQTMFAFEPYLAANKNTEKPILHISLNPIRKTNRPTPNSNRLHPNIWKNSAMATNPI